jgi:hypothetical protein
MAKNVKLDEKTITELMASSYANEDEKKKAIELFSKGNVVANLTYMLGKVKMQFVAVYSPLTDEVSMSVEMANNRCYMMSSYSEFTKEMTEFIKIVDEMRKDGRRFKTA